MLTNIQQLSTDIQKVLLRLKLSLKTQNFYLLGIFSTLAILHLNIISNHRLESENIAFYALYWGGILYLLWKNPPTENNPSIISSYLGLGLLLFVIFRPINLWYLDQMLFRFAPIVAGFGLGLLSFGFLGLKHHWKMFLLLLLMLFPYSFINGILDSKLNFPEVTAAISAFLLHYLGLGATHYGNFVKLPTGAVEVIYPCTGGALIIWLLQIILLITVITVNLTWKQKWSLIISAIVVGFFVGCIRVALLALVVNNQNLFDYWHGPDGATIFMMIATISFASLCNWILPLEVFSLSKISQPTNIKSKRRFFLATTWLGIIVTAIYLIVTKKPIGTNIFTDQMTMSNWQQIEAKSLGQHKYEIPGTGKFILLESGQDYIYLQNNQKIEIKMRYVVNTRGQINPFLLNLSKDLKQEAEKNIKQLQVGYYTLFSDDKKAYLTACINPRGGSTVTTSQFMLNRYKYDVTRNRLVPWLLGQNLLRDDRCIWTQLSLTINENIATDISTVLESTWKDNYATWQFLLVKSN